MGTEMAKTKTPSLFRDDVVRGSDRLLFLNKDKLLEVIAGWKEEQSLAGLRHRVWDVRASIGR